MLGQHRVSKEGAFFRREGPFGDDALPFAKQVGQDADIADLDRGIGVSHLERHCGIAAALDRTFFDQSAKPHTGARRQMLGDVGFNQSAIAVQWDTQQSPPKVIGAITWHDVFSFESDVLLGTPPVIVHDEATQQLYMSLDYVSTSYATKLQWDYSQTFPPVQGVRSVVHIINASVAGGLKLVRSMAMPNVTSPWADRYGVAIDAHRYTIGGRLYTTAAPLSQPPGFPDGLQKDGENLSPINQNAPDGI